MSTTVRKKRKLKKSVKILLVLLAILFLIGAGGQLYMGSLLNKMNKTGTMGQHEAGIAEEIRHTPVNKNIFNFLLFGADSNTFSENEGMDRADATKIISLDKANKTIKIASLQRDTMVWIPDPVDDFSKLNHAYWWGDADLAIRTVNVNYDMNITKYVTFSMTGLEAMVDELGGVDIYLTKAESTYFQDGLIKQTNYQEGTFHLSGHEARAYAQLREIDNDYNRMNRQNVLIKTILLQLKNSSVTQLLSLVETVMPYIETNFTNAEIELWLTRMLTYDLKNIETQDVPKGDEKDRWAEVEYNGYPYIIILRNYEKMVQDLYEFLYGMKNYSISTQAAGIHDDIYQKFADELK